MRRVVGKQARKIEVEREKRQELQYLGGQKRRVKTKKKKKTGNKISLESEACVLLWGAPIQITVLFRL